MVKEDSILAQQIVGLTHNNRKNTLFHNESAIYIKSNERIQDYRHYFNNRKDILSVIASGDQILSMIFNGGHNIDVFDISPFPKYYMYLKLAGIQSLNIDEYIDFFYRVENKAEEYDDMYFDLIRNNINEDAKEFWDSLINFYDWNEIVNSPLFSSEPVSITNIYEQLDYLDKESYIKLRDLISKVNINTHEGNIIEIYNKFNNPYDLIYLSNIIYYVNTEQYKNMLKAFNLNNNGIILTYLYDSLNQINNYFNEKEFKVEQFKDNTCGVLIRK